MPRPFLALVATAGLLAVGACTPYDSFQGYQAINANPSSIEVGKDSRSTVLAKLGSPTAKSNFDNNIWFYLSQTSSKTGFYQPKVVSREIVSIAFNKDSQQVDRVNVYGLENGRVIALNTHSTPTRGREMTILEQMFGSLSTIGSLPPDQDYTPGSRPGGTP
jgi:outer membrane protein assembly factor BamE (lipoprotein component of BamABCDE complex)